MTSHDDTPSTEERERARAELEDRHQADMQDGDRCNEIAVDLQVRANRLAARVAELSDQLEQARVQLAGCGCEALGYASDCNPGDYGWSESLGDVRRIRTELAKLRAAAAPVELPEGWKQDGDGGMCGPEGRRVWSDKGRTWVYNRDVDRACAAPSDALRHHLLAPPPQEDVRGAIADWLGGDAYHDMFEAQAGLETPLGIRHWLAERIRTWPTAPRTEGGGE